jgi:hypothetical protein
MTRPVTYYNEHDGRFQIHWMDGPHTEVAISEDVTLFVQGSVQGVIVGVEIPQPKEITKLCAEIAKLEETIKAAVKLADTVGEQVEQYNCESCYKGCGDGSCVRPEQLEDAHVEFTQKHDELLKLQKEHHDGTG